MSSISNNPEDLKLFFEAALEGSHEGIFYAFDRETLLVTDILG
ncbi:MAG: hypothetical protein PQJ59_17390 [Spirochaetales bacterium]|nr:hypothetical protein [Spirochaetales bacterium]